MLEDTRSEKPLLRASWKVSKLVACNFRLLMRQPRLGLSEKILPANWELVELLLSVPILSSEH